MWQVIPNLHLGDREDSHDRALLGRTGITHIVNCAAELPCAFPGEFAYLPLGLSDPDPNFQLRVADGMAFIDSARRSGAALVHCTTGVSRSAAIVLAYLCHFGKPVESACLELSRAVLTGIDESFLRQIAERHGLKLTREGLKRLSLILAGHQLP